MIIKEQPSEMGKLKVVAQSLAYMFGAHLSFIVYGLFQQTIFTHEYVNAYDGSVSKFSYSQAAALFPALFCFLIGKLKGIASKQTESKLPGKQQFILGSLFYLMQYTIGTALVYISYPTQLIFTNMKLLTIYLVESFCSRIPQRVKKMEKARTVMGILITIGIFFYSYDKINKTSDKNNYGFGILLVIVSLVSQGFLVDSQTYVKIKYQPSSNDMFTETNKVSFIVSLIMCISVGEFLPILRFIFNYQKFGYHLFAFCAAGTAGQMCLYVLIKKFKPSICAICAILRKVITMTISILLFNHQTSIVQIIGIVIVFVGIFYQLYTQFTPSKNTVKSQKE